jgi:hypothetical protein
MCELQSCTRIWMPPIMGFAASFVVGPMRQKHFGSLLSRLTNTLPALRIHGADLDWDTCVSAFSVALNVKRALRVPLKLHLNPPIYRLNQTPIIFLLSFPHYPSTCQGKDLSPVNQSFTRGNTLQTTGYFSKPRCEPSTTKSDREGNTDII